MQIEITDTTTTRYHPSEHAGTLGLKVLQASNMNTGQPHKFGAHNVHVMKPYSSAAVRFELMRLKTVTFAMTMLERWYPIWN